MKQPGNEAVAVVGVHLRAGHWTETAATMEGAQKLEELHAILSRSALLGRQGALFAMSPPEVERAIRISKAGAVLAEWTRRGSLLVLTQADGAEIATEDVIDAIGITTELLVGAEHV